MAFGRGPDKKKKWHEAKGDDELLKLVFAHAYNLECEGAGRRRKMLKLASRYEGQRLGTLYGNPDEDRDDLTPPSTNLIANLIDTLKARYGATPTFITVATQGGNFKARQRAKKLTKAIDGWFYQNKVNDLDARATVHSLLWPLGCIVLDTDIDDDDAEEPAGQVTAWTAAPDEVLVGHDDGLEGNPHEFCVRRFPTRSELKSRFPKHAKAIDDLTSNGINSAQTGVPRGTERVACLWMWKLPDKRGKGGRKIVVAGGENGVVLCDLEWTHPWFPACVLRWRERPRGYYGKSLADQIYPKQVRLDRIELRIQECIDRMAYPRVIYDSAAECDVDDMGGKIGGGIKWNSSANPGCQPPVFVQPPAVPAELWQEKKALIDEAYQEIGISQWAARQEKPAGVTAAAALETLKDEESNAHQDYSRRREDFRCELATKMVALAKELYSTPVVGKDGKKKKRKIRFNVPGRKFLESVDFGDADMEADAFELRPFRISNLPNTPAGRAQAIYDMYAAGQMSYGDYLRALETYDIEAPKDLATAAANAIEARLDDMVFEGEDGYRSPNQYLDLTLALKMAHARLLHEESLETPAERLGLIAQFIDEIQSLLEAGVGGQQTAPVATANTQAPGPQAPAGDDPAQAA